MPDLMIYEPDYRSKLGTFSILRECFRTVFQRRDLLFYLIVRDFLSEYKRSFIGMGWVLISPVLAIASWVLINYTSVLNPGELDIPYPVYVLVSTMVWGLFIGIYQSVSNIFFESVSFGFDVKCHRQVLIAKQIVLHFLNFAIGLFFLFATLVYYGIYPSWAAVLCPLALLPLILLGSGVGLFISVFSVVLPDSKRWIDFGMQLLMFVTPVIYSPKVDNPVIREIIRYNPLSYLVNWARATLVGGGFEDPGKFSLSVLASLLIFLLGLRFLYLSEDKVIEKIY